MKTTLLLITAICVFGCASDPAPEAISDEKAKAAQAKFETSGQASQTPGTPAPQASGSSESAPVEDQ